MYSQLWSFQRTHPRDILNHSSPPSGESPGKEISEQESRSLCLCPSSPRRSPAPSVGRLFASMPNLGSPSSTPWAAVSSNTPFAPITPLAPPPPARTPAQHSASGTCVGPSPSSPQHHSAGSTLSRVDSIQSLPVSVFSWEQVEQPANVKILQCPESITFRWTSTYPCPHIAARRVYVHTFKD